MNIREKTGIATSAVIVIVIVIVAVIAGAVLMLGQPTPTTTTTPTTTSPTTTSPTTTTQPVKNPDTLIYATIGEQETLDPAWAYDTASSEVIMSVYETLISFDGTHTDKFVPKLATEVPTVANGGISADGLTYRFKIRSGVKFHNGDDLTPEDVEYSFERAMVQNRDGGPVWMLLEPLIGIEAAYEPLTFEQIDKAVEVEGDYVVFHLAQPYPPFLAILAQSWSSIVDKEWCIEQGDWPGTAETWENYRNPETPPLQEVMNGTGPFKLDRWEHGVQTVLTRNDQYWGGPAKLKNVVIQVVPEWTTRKLMFLAGDADIVDVPRPNIKELEGVEGIRVTKDLPTLAVDAMFFTMKIDPNSEWIGSGQLDGNGIPPDFFADKNVRLAFAYSFDYEAFLRDVYQGEAIQPASPVIEGLPYHNPAQEKYHLDLAKAEQYFKAAFGGQVWEKGFKMTILYNTGNEPRRIAAEILKKNIESLNPKFSIEVAARDWGTYLKEMVASKLTLYIIGWLADYPDPHNFVQPFMHSAGAFSAWQGYSNPTVDDLIMQGISEIDPAKRQQIYYQLQQIYHDDVPSVPIDQALGRHYERDWVHGWIYNPIWPGEPALCDPYLMWKG